MEISQFFLIYRDGQRGSNPLQHLLVGAPQNFEPERFGVQATLH